MRPGPPCLNSYMCLLCLLNVPTVVAQHVSAVMKEGERKRGRGKERKKEGKEGR